MTIYSLTLTQFLTTITDGRPFVMLKQGDGPSIFFLFFFLFYPRLVI